MKKTLLIGIGGTGLTAIREVRRLIAERYELGLEAPEVASVKFLYIDTHEGDIDTLNWSVLGKDIRLTDDEKVIITGNNLRPMVENPDDYPDVAPWLPGLKNYVGDPGAGAKGIRPYGRLIYEYNQNKGEVRDKVVECYNSLNQSFAQIQEWRFYLVCGLSGGTGSGMFVPLSIDLQRWDLYQKGTTLKKFYSFLVLPPLQIVGRHNRYHSNAYAALSELNYFAFQPEQLPYDNCYLLEPRNAKGLEMGLENLPLLIAQRIFLNIQGGPAASYIDAIMDNPQLGDVEDDRETGRRHSLRFSTFGLSTVSYPREVVAQCFAYRLAEQVVSAWLKERVYKQNINEQVRDELKSIRLSLSHVYRDADPFGHNDFPDYEVQINNLVDENLQGITKRQLGANVEKVRRRIEISFRDNIGIKEFYQQRIRDVSGAVTESLEQTRFKITAFLCSPEFGINYAKRFLDELINILKDEFKTDVSKMASESNQKTIRTFQDNLADTVAVVRANEQKFMYTNRDFQNDYANISDELKQYLKSLASFEVGKYGLAFLDRIIPQITNLRDELGVWESRVGELQQNLAGRLKVILEDIEKGTKENGKTIFSEFSLQKLVEETNFSVIQTSIEDQIKVTFGQENLDLIFLVTLTEPEDLIYESAYQWVLSKNCPIDIKRLTLYDKFVSEYPNSVKRQEILSSAKMLSAPFLKFAPSEVGKKQILSTKASVTTIPDGTGRTISDGRPAQTVVQTDLEAIGVSVDRIKVAEDEERIIFLQEEQVFPLRFIESLSRLKENYDQFPERPALHIDRTIEPYLYELYMLSTDEKKVLLETEEVFIISRAYSWIACKTNQHTRKDEIRYEFEEPGLVGVQKPVLGFNWETAFEAFVKDCILSISQSEQVRNARERLTAKARQLRNKAKTDLIVADDIRKKLEDYLQTCSREYASGIDDPRYERAQKVINRIVNSLN